MPTKKMASTTSETPQQLQAVLQTAADFKLIYANFIQSAFSPLDVAFVFGEVMGVEDDKQVVLTKARVTMTPAEAEEL